MSAGIENEIKTHKDVDLNTLGLALTLCLGVWGGGGGDMKQQTDESFHFFHCLIVKMSMFVAWKR